MSPNKQGSTSPWRDGGGRELTVEELAARVIAKIEALAGSDRLATHGHRLLFAIAVHSLECWLLPLLYSDHHAKKITGCLQAANEARYRSNEKPLSKPAPRSAASRPAESKDYRVYEAVSRGYLKRKKLMDGGEKNRSLGLFLEKLAAMQARRASSLPAAAAAPEAAAPAGSLQASSAPLPSPPDQDGLPTQDRRRND